MAINKAMRATLKAISYLGMDVDKTYKAERALGTLSAKLQPKLPLYKMWDYAVLCGDHAVPVRIFEPPQESGNKVLVFFHGGGWVTGNIDSYERVCMELAIATGHTVLAVDYRLAPEYKFPAGVEDCYAVVRTILCGHLMETPDITLIGDSAGGNLAAAVSLMARDRGEIKIDRQILIYPATYFEHGPEAPFASIHENGTDYLLTSKRVDEFMALYRSSEKDNMNPYYAPLNAKSLANQPRTLIITAEFCPLRDEGEFYGEQLRIAGGDVTIYRMKDGLHGFFTLPPRFVHVKRTHELINKFLQKEEK